MNNKLRCPSCGGPLKVANKRIEELEAQQWEYERSASSIIASKDKRIKELEEAERLLKKIIPLIPDFNAEKDYNEPITNYQYLKFCQRWQTSNR